MPPRNRVARGPNLPSSTHCRRAPARNCERRMDSCAAIPHKDARASSGEKRRAYRIGRGAAMRRHTSTPHVYPRSRFGSPRSSVASFCTASRGWGGRISFAGPADPLSDRLFLNSRMPLPSDAPISGMRRAPKSTRTTISKRMIFSGPMPPTVTSLRGVEVKEGSQAKPEQGRPRPVEEGIPLQSP